MLHFDCGPYRVGPDSAGADPGPACYRRGGPLPLTDANVMLGRIRPEHFPHVFGAAGDQPIDAGVVREGFAVLAAEIGDGRPPEDVAAGFVEIAVIDELRDEERGAKRVLRRAHLRYAGTDTALPVEVAAVESMVAEFEWLHDVQMVADDQVDVG
ncbi:MAG TPA: hydantoinase/oxoprolinase family protein [Spirillospora sp.]|nr:hydantoinase/oxoprolinase family protein [Spirillospora sp.]